MKEQLAYKDKQQGCRNSGFAAEHDSEVENRTHLICNYNGASAVASFHLSPIENSYYSKTESLYSCHHLLWNPSH